MITIKRTGSLLAQRKITKPVSQFLYELQHISNSRCLECHLSFPDLEKESGLYLIPSTKYALGAPLQKERKSGIQPMTTPQYYMTIPKRYNHRPKEKNCYSLMTRKPSFRIISLENQEFLSPLPLPFTQVNYPLD